MRRVAALVLAGWLLATPQAALAAEGPGYSGDAGGLSVFWTRTDVPLPPDVPAQNPAGAAADPQRVRVQREEFDLQVTGIGFRGLSEVEVQVGTSDAVTTRADETGTIQVTLPAPEAAAPGTSVVAIGRGPAGGSRTVTGAVPPLPDGANLMRWLRWGVLGLVLLGAAAAVARWREQRGDLSAAPAPAGPVLAWYPMPAPSGPAIALPPPQAAQRQPATAGR
jgi:hypothetical protein